MRHIFTRFLFFLIAAEAVALGNPIHESCKSLCENESECTRKCINHSELFELRSDFINAVTEWTPLQENRLKALRSGANTEILDLCQGTGWSLENKLICLRSYPTREIIKACKKRSLLEEDQVRCVRNGNSETKKGSCPDLNPSEDRRLNCLERAPIAESKNQTNKTLEARILGERKKIRSQSNPKNQQNND